MSDLNNLSGKQRRKRHADNNNSTSCNKNLKLDPAAKENRDLMHIQDAEDQRCGKILRIHLTNFMCHSNLTIELHKRINFLVGSNGSGKSSIMAAIVVGLGGATRASSRSSNLRNLIQKGKISAKIEIDIYNDGPQAYEAEDFGSVITVVRTITQTSSSYVIKSEWGRVVSRKHDDLQRILLFHNLQPDNPVFVMNQESTRNFLKSMEPEKNYKLFLKATQIELIVEKLKDCRQYHEDQVFNLNCLKEQVEERHNEVTKIRDRVQKVLSLEKLKAELKTKQVELAWAFVKEKKKAITEKERTQGNINHEREQLQRSLSNRDQHRLELQQSMSELENKVADLEKKCAEMSQAVQQNSALCVKKSCELDAVQREANEYHRQLQTLEASIEDFRRNIKEREKENPEDVAEKKLQNENEILKLQENLLVLKNKKKELLEVHQEFMEQVNEKEAELNELKQQQKYSYDKIEKCRSDLRKSAAKEKNKLYAYGHHVPELLEEIKAEYKRGNFKEMPRGPIGNYLAVENEEYCSLIEHCLGSLLNAFIVSCSDDRLKLQRLFSKYRDYTPPVITTAFTKQVYNTRGRAVIPPDETHLLLNEIKCSDPVVLNCLIDQRRIESILLTRHKATAERYAAQQENVPNNLLKIYTLKPHMEIYPDPLFRMYSLNVSQAHYLQQNTKNIMRALEDNMNNEKNRLLESKDVIATAQREFQQLKNELKQILNNLSLNQNNQQNIEAKIRDLQNIEYPDFNQTEFLRKELRSDEKKLENAQEVFKEMKMKLVSIKEEFNQSTQIMRDAEALLKKKQHETNEVKAKIRDAKKNLNHLDELFLKKSDRIKSLDEQLYALQKEIDEGNHLLAELTKKAAAIGVEIEIHNLTTDLQDVIKKLNYSIQKYTLMGVSENLPELQEILNTQQQLLIADQNNFEILKGSIEQLEQSLRERFDFVKKLRVHMSMLLQFTFNQILKARNFHGKVDIDFAKKILDLKVIPRLLDGQECVSSTRALSGGERSYSTVAFLLSLWACVDHPFFFLDEYDVFTDEVNREYMTRLLIAEGKKRPNRQFVFLTPLDMSVAASDIIKIHRLAPPKR